MKALTLIQPWSWCITHAGKRVENRTWAPPVSLLGERFAIHAGKAPEIDEAVSQLALEGITVPYGTPRGAVVATVRLVGVAYGNGSRWRLGSNAPGYFRCDPLVTARDGLWFSGPIGWVLDDVVALPRPVPARGAQGLWTLPPEIAAQVADQEAEVRRA